MSDVEFWVDSERTAAVAAAYVGRLNVRDGKGYRVNIHRHDDEKSRPQTKLKWLWMDTFRNFYNEATGQRLSKEDADEFFRETFLGYTIIQLPDGRISRKPNPTPRSKKDYAEYMNKIDMYCASELQLHLPRPEELYYKAMGYEQSR